MPLGSFVSLMLSSTFQSAFPFPFHCAPFQSGACGQRSLEKAEPGAAGSLQKSEAKAKEKVIYTLYLVKPQCIQISERLFEVAGSLEVDLLSHRSSKQQEM